MRNKMPGEAVFHKSKCKPAFRIESYQKEAGQK